MYDVLARERLFDLLDRGRERTKALCVVGPPGSGKTTLAATWLEKRHIGGIWFQIDRGDCDIASFFFFLGLAAQGHGRRGRRVLPVLGPEFLSDLPGFSRRYFRDLFSRLPAGSTLVFDNYQEVPADSMLHSLVAEAIHEIPDGQTLIVISRAAPPDCYARLIANSNVTFVDWEQLKVTPVEARQIATRRAEFSRAMLDRICDISGGWMAGLTLLLEGAKRNERIGLSPGDSHFQHVFSYFATEILGDAPPAQQLALMKLSLLPRMTVRLAEDLTGDPHSGRLLEQLYRRRLFIDRRPGTDATYQFHALFRSFLLHRARSEVPHSELASLIRHCANLLAEAGMFEDAASLFKEAEDWDGLQALIGACAAEMVATGRWQTLQGWIGSVPAQCRDASPWLQYWSGVARMATAPGKARELLTNAHSLALECDDQFCQHLCAATIIETCCIEWSRFSLMDPWIDVLAAAMQGEHSWPSIDAELRVAHAFVCALVYRRPEHPDLMRQVEHLFALMDKAKDVNLKLVSACTITNYSGHSCRFDLTPRGLLAIEGLIDDPAVTISNHGAALFSLVWGYWVTMNPDHAHRLAQKLIRHAQDSGLAYMGIWGIFMAVHIHGNAMEFGEARQMLEHLKTQVDPARWYDMAELCCAASWLALYDRTLDHAIKLGPQGIALIEDGVVASKIQWAFPLAMAHAERGETAASHHWIEHCESIIERHQLECYRPWTLAARAMLAFKSDDEHAICNALERFLRASTASDNNQLSWIRSYLPDLLAAASLRGLEPSAVARLARRYSTPSPDPNMEVWPWPIRVRMLDSFELEVDGQAVTFRGKSPRKPLAVLKAVICLGGQQVPLTVLADLLWPDSDGDAAMTALGVALHRLRRLVRHERALNLSDGKLSIDRSLMWVDAFAFESLACDSSTRRMATGSQAMALYRGDLLSKESDLAWAIPMRRRLRDVYVGTSSALGRPEVNAVASP